MRGFHEGLLGLAQGEGLGHCNQMGGMEYMPFRDVLYMRLIPTKPLRRPLAEQLLVSSTFKYGAMGSRDLKIPILNQYGAVVFAPAGNTNNIDAMTQYSPNGEVWAINADIMRQGDRGDDKWYIVTAAEDAFLETLRYGLAYMRDVAEVELPIKVTAGVAGMKGRRVVVSGAALGMHGRMMTDAIEHTMIFHDDLIEAQDKFLLQLFEKIFDQSGNSRPRGLSEPRNMLNLAYRMFE